MNAISGLRGRRHRWCRRRCGPLQAAFEQRDHLCYEARVVEEIDCMRRKRARIDRMRGSTLRKNILITGASSGLGAGMAREFAKRGRNLALCARRNDRLLELQVELRASAPEARVVVRELDVNDSAAVFRVFRETASELGSLDRVIVNAGV